MAWHSRDVLVTGASGLIGAELCRELRARGAGVRAVDIEPSPGVQRFDVRDPKITALVPQGGVVFHLASIVGVVNVLRRPQDCYQISVEGTARVMQAAQARDASLVFASSSEVYGEGEGRLLHEEDPLPSSYGAWPRASYPLGKRRAERLVLDVAAGARPGRVARLFNVSGPSQEMDSGMVLPTLVSQARRGKPMTLVNAGEDVRCFQHVRDAVQGLLKLASVPGLDGQIVNLGGESILSMRGLASRVAQVLGVKEQLRFVDDAWRYGAPSTRCRYRVPDSSRAQRLLGHRPTVALDELIRDLAAAQAACAESLAAPA
ncbi:MAG: hypothetical protein CSA62_13070 [Planctomycetota bacterium]|nr:MAG: hypothetical protein CSA62_13070 [Planctomycetota bacterium]